MRSNIIFIIVISLLLYGCKVEKKQPVILSKEKMGLVLWDIMGAAAFTDQYIKKDSLNNALKENMKLQQQIFLLHKVTREDFYASYRYYANKPDLIKPVLDSIAAKGERMRSKMTEQQHSSGNHAK